MRDVHLREQQGKDSLLLEHEIIETNSNLGTKRGYIWIGKMACGTKGQ
jgi:hypothetical protein